MLPPILAEKYILYDNIKLKNQKSISAYNHSSISIFSKNIVLNNI